MNEKVKITKKSKIKGDDGYKVFSIRLKEDMVGTLNNMVTRTQRSRNEIITTLLEYAIEHCEIED